MSLSQRDFDKQFGALILQINQQTTPFPKNTEAQMARIRRAKADRFFFAATYFPHYIILLDEYKDCWKTPDKNFDWIHAGFSPDHAEFFQIGALLGKFSILAGYRESAKDTLLNHIDLIAKLIFEERWFIPIVSENETKAEGKSIPVKLEFEKNQRLIQDFGNLVGHVKWENGAFHLRSGRGVQTYGREQSLRGENIAGHRPDHIIANDINDPTKPDSPRVVKKFVNSVKADMLYAVNSPRWSALLLCNYTVKDDIVDLLLTGKNTAHYNKRIFRALIPNPKKTSQEKEIARLCREAGFPDGRMSAWEFRHPTLRLLQEEKDDPETFAKERMMIPQARDDQRFKDHYFKFHTKSELKTRNYIYYTYVDPSAKEAADYKAVITIGVGLKDDLPHLPVCSASIKQQSVDEMMLETYNQKKLYSSKIVGVETNGFQILLKREYLRLQKKHGLLPFMEIEHYGESKESRIERIVPFVKEGMITFDIDDPNQELLIQQLKVFPNGGQVSAGGYGDDGADALAGCIELVEKYPSGIGQGKYKTVQKREAVFSAGAY